MRRRNTTLIALVSVALLAGSTVGVAAQDETGTVGVVDLTYAKGKFVQDESAVKWDDVRDLDAELHGPAGFVVEASDPRLSGAGVSVGMIGDYAPPGIDDPDLPPLTGFPALLVVHEWLRISNADGSWVGQSGPHFVATDIIELEGNKRQRRKARRQGSFLVTGPTILSGAGAYEGLTAYLYFPFEANEDLQRGNPKDDADDAGEPFKAVIVNRVNPGFPTEDQLALRVRDYTAPPTE